MNLQQSRDPFDSLPKSKREIELKEALDKRFVDPRSYIGQLFVKSVKESGKFEAYKGKSNPEKSKERVDWAQLQFDNIQESKSFMASTIHADKDIGTFLPFGKVVIEEGGWGDATAIVAAKKYCSKCLHMKGRWIRYNSMTERVEFLHLKKEVSDILSQTWSRYVQYHNKEQPPAMAVSSPSQAQGRGAPPNESTKAEPNSPATEPVKEPSEDTQKDPTAKDTPAKDTPAKPTRSTREKTALELKWAEIANIKREAMTYSALAQSIVAQISINSPSWSFANNEQNLGLLKDCFSEFTSRLGPSGQMIMTSTLQELKNTIGDDDKCMTAIQDFSKIREPLAVLKAAATRLRQRHQAGIIKTTGGAKAKAKGKAKPKAAPA